MKMEVDHDCVDFETVVAKCVFGAGSSVCSLGWVCRGTRSAGYCLVWQGNRRIGHGGLQRWPDVGHFLTTERNRAEDVADRWHVCSHPCGIFLGLLDGGVFA